MTQSERDLDQEELDSARPGISGLVPPYDREATSEAQTEVSDWTTFSDKPMGVWAATVGPVSRSSRTRANKWVAWTPAPRARPDHPPAPNRRPTGVSTGEDVTGIKPQPRRNRGRGHWS
jgi:hypothetical protein